MSEHRGRAVGTYVSVCKVMGSIPQVAYTIFFFEGDVKYIMCELAINYQTV